MKYLIALGIIIHFFLIENSFAGCTPTQIEKMLTAGFTKSEIQDICNQGSTTQDTEKDQPIPPQIIPFSFSVIPFQNMDFKEGSKVAYRADFSAWPRKKNQHGIAQPANGGYEIEAKSNTWVGPGRHIKITTDIRKNFILNLTFRVVHKTDTSLHITMSDAGKNYSQVDFFFDIWSSGKLTYSVYENWVKNNFYVNTKRKFAERLPVNFNTEQINWHKDNLLTIKRDNTRMSFYLNSINLDTFYIPTFPFKQIGIGLAFRSKIHFKSIEARIPK